MLLMDVQPTYDYDFKAVQCETDHKNIYQSFWFTIAFAFHLINLISNLISEFNWVQVKE